MEGLEFDEVWEDIYTRGEQLNQYPFDSVVSFLMRQCSGKERRQIRVLELGCGAGNNLWAAAREGFKVVGIDASRAAISYAQKRFQEEKLSGAFYVANFVDLPIEDGTVDIVIDRAALNQVPHSVAKHAIREAQRVLLPGGVIYSEIYSDESRLKGTRVDGCYEQVASGLLSGIGQVATYSKDEIEKLFSPEFEIFSMRHRLEEEVVNTSEALATWLIQGRKNG